MTFKLIIRKEFRNQLDNYDKVFQILIRNRIKYLSINPHKYTMLASHKLLLNTIKVSNGFNDIRIVFKIIENNVVILILYNWDDGLEHIQSLYKELE